MSACELFRGGVSKPDGTRAVIAIVFDPYLPRELNVKVHFLQGGQECSDFEVWIAEALATSSTGKEVLQQRAQDLGNALQLEYTSRGNGAPTLFIAADAVHAPPITLTRGVKVQVQTAASNSIDEWRLGKISRARQDGSVNVQFLDATKEYSVPRSRLRVMGRYRPGQYKGYLADAQTNAHASKTQNVGFTGAFDMDQRSIYEAASIKIQTVYRSHLARSVLNWLRGKRANASANVAPARYGTQEPILNRDPAKLPPEPTLPPLPHRLAPESINATTIPIPVSANVQGEGLLQAPQHVSSLPSTARTQTPRSARPPAGPPNSPATQVEANASLSSSSLSSSSSESSLSTSSDEDDESDDAEDVEVSGNARRTAAESKHSDIMSKRPIKKKHTAPSRAPPAKHTSLPSREAPATQRFTPSYATSGQETSFKSREREEKEFAETKSALQVHASATISTKTSGTSSAQQAPRRHSSPAVSSPKSPSTIPEEPVAAVAERIGSTGKVQVYSVTFNAHSKGRQALAGDVIAKMIAPGYDIYCLAFQDLRTGGDPLRETLTSILPPAYIELRGVSMQRMHLFIYIHASLLPLVKDVQSDHVFFGVDLGNETIAPKGERIKGAVAISFQMRGKSFVFVNSHFKGQPTDDASRDANFHEINVRFKLPLNKLQTTTPISQRFDFAWWLGDLNYRVHLDSMVPSVAESHKVLNEGNLGKLLERDGLLNNNHAFEDYEEMPISFPPTFRFNQTTGAYCDKSVPSWTDRILVKRDQPECAWLSYGMLNAVCTSVHKPVFAAHAVTLAEPHGIWSDWHAAQAEFMKRVQAEADAAAKANVGVSAGTSKSIGLGAKVLGAKGKAKAAQQQEVSFRMDTEANANKSRACVIQ